MTRTNQLLGTPEFMSPEQVRDASSIEPASDVYSFGLLIYCAATGSMPYDVSEGAAGALAHLSEAPRPLRAVLPDAPVALEEILAACLAKEAHARPSARTVASRLAAIADALGVGAVETLEDWREPTAIDVEAAETVSVREA
jgi:serine/threonine-protein kinase